MNAIPHASYWPEPTPLPGPARPLVEVEGLEVAFGHAPPVVSGISFQLHAGQCLALVGESGSGKSVTARSLAGLAGQGARVGARRLSFDGLDLRTLDARAWQRLRGARVGFVMQDALGSLDPLRRVGQEVEEPLRLHTAWPRAHRQSTVLELLRTAGMPEPELRARQYPHQLSGGLRQRALIASAIACHPQLLVADEPTTALDVTVQAQILDLLQSLRASDRALLVVSHDLAVVARLADTVAVMRHGRIVEQGSVEQVLQDPRHPYTKALLCDAVAVHIERLPGPALVDPAPPAMEPHGPVVLEADGLHKGFPGPDGRMRPAVAGVSFRLHAGQTLGIVGESGSGKTTLTRLVLGLEQPDRGTVRVRGRDWRALDGRARRAERRRIQVVFQDPLASFDPRYTVRRVLEEALAQSQVPRALREARLLELLQLVRLDPAVLGRRPIEPSGGQRQREAIARALAPDPEVLVCDEPVSALDVSVQAQVLDLLADLRQRLGLACVFISHDLGVIRRISDQVLVMKDGVAVESGPVDAIFRHPRHPYTRSLLDAIPRLPHAAQRHVPQPGTVLPRPVAGARPLSLAAGL